MSKDWAAIRVKTEVDAFDAVRTKILGWPEEVAQEVYWPELEQISKDALEYMRDIIQSEDSNTKTGEKGGRTGRVKTGKMLHGTRARARARKDGFSFFVGWLEGKPGYAIFQELGTRNGIIGMNAVSQTREYVISRLRQMAAGKYSANRQLTREDFDD